MGCSRAEGVEGMECLINVHVALNKNGKSPRKILSAY